MQDGRVLYVSARSSLVQVTSPTGFVSVNVSALPGTTDDEQGIAACTLRVEVIRHPWQKPGSCFFMRSYDSHCVIAADL